MYNNNTQQSRLTDSHSAEFYRSDRLYASNGLWYFRTREGNEVGPFRYRDEAELMLTKFVQELLEHQQQSLASSKPHFRISGVVGRRQPG
jgi:hypothetical protein